MKKINIIFRQNNTISKPQREDLSNVIVGGAIIGSLIGYWRSSKAENNEGSSGGSVKLDGTVAAAGVGISARWPRGGATAPAAIVIDG